MVLHHTLPARPGHLVGSRPLVPGEPVLRTSGGPWIKPQLSRQKVVWKDVSCVGTKGFDDILPLPAVDKKWNHYRDIAVLAFPVGKAPVAPGNGIDLSKLMDASGRLIESLR